MGVETLEPGVTPLTRSARSSTISSIKRKPVASNSISQSAPIFPVTLKFAFGPFGLHCWYDAAAIEPRRAKLAEGEEEPESSYWSGDNDARRYIVTENPVMKARTMQLYACSPRLVTTCVFTESDGIQQNKSLAPYQGLMQKFGKHKREHERSVMAEQDISAWLALCLVNQVSPKDIHIAFGPGESYYAWTPGGRVIRRGLPIDLQELLDSHESPPTDLSMGIDGTWWVRWEDGTHDQYIQQNSYQDLCLLLENIDIPQLKRIYLNPSSANEFLVEYANGHFFLRARCLPRDIQRLNEYLRERQSDIKVVVLGVIHNVLKEDIVCEPFVLPTDDLENSPIMLGKELCPEQMPEWMEQARSGIELAKTVTEIAQAAGACSVM